MQVESKSNTAANTSRPSHADSPRSSSSVLTSGDDSVMPHQIVEHEYELHMPVLPNPRPYWRFPNATEAYRSGAVSSQTGHTGQRLALNQPSTALSSVQSSHSDGGLHADHVLTDDSGMKLTGSRVSYNGGKPVEFTADQLQVRTVLRTWSFVVALCGAAEFAVLSAFYCTSHLRWKIQSLSHRAERTLAWTC